MVSLAETGGGVAVVARLLWEVYRERWPDAHLLQLIETTRAQPTFSDKVRYALSLAALQATGRVDSVFYAHLNLAKPLRGIPGRLHRPYAVFLHGIEAWCPLSPSQLELLAGARVRIANSSFTARRVMQTHPSIGHVEACPLALPAASPVITAVPRATRAHGDRAVLIVGRLSSAERYKGHEQLIESWPQVIAAVPDAVLVIAGDGDDAPRLRALAASSGVGATIRFTGFIPPDALDALYRTAAVFAMPSRAEGFGLVYLEAMARRLPCVGSVHDAARDVIVDGETGLLVDQDRPGALSAALVSLLTDETMRVRMGERGEARLRGEFTAARFRDRLFSVLDAAPAMTGAA